jgi:hypothetical protein
MRKWLIASLILVALMIVAVTVSAGTSFKEKTKEKPKFECKGMADQNKDGICDNYSTPNCKHAEGCVAGVLDNNKDKKCAAGCKEGKKCSGECKDSLKYSGECKKAGEEKKCSGECKKAEEEKKCSGECKKTTEEKKCSGECSHKEAGCAAKQSAETSSCCSNKK